MYPGFIGIGAQKGGTTWLGRNLGPQPAVWVPAIEEIHDPPNPTGLRVAAGFAKTVVRRIAGLGKIFGFLRSGRAWA